MTPWPRTILFLSGLAAGVWLGNLRIERKAPRPVTSHVVAPDQDTTGWRYDVSWVVIASTGARLVTFRIYRDGDPKDSKFIAITPRQARRAALLLGEEAERLEQVDAGVLLREEAELEESRR